MARAKRSHQRLGMVVGKVEFREGEGIMLEIRIGAIEVALTRVDATLSWTDGNYRGQAAMPYGDFRRYVAEGAIALK
jgi:glutathione S-transferase